MPLEKEDKKSIIKYRIEKSHKTMIEARDCATMGHWTLAANRLYYSLFYISNALLVDKGIFAKTHAGVIAKINEHFIKTGLLSKDEGRTISILQNMRQSGDYDDCFEWSEADISPFFKRTEDLLLKMESLISCRIE